MNRELEDRESASSSHGRALVSLWTELFRALRIADARSDHVVSYGERIRALLAESCDADGASFAVRADAIFFNGSRLPELGVRATTQRSFARVLRIARVRSFCIDPAVDLAELISFAERVLAAAEGRSAPEQIVTGLKPSGASGIEVVIGNTEDESAIQIPGHELQKRVFLGAIGVVKSVYHEVRTANRIHGRRLKRCVQELIGTLEYDPVYALRLTAVKNYDEYTFNHSVNVAVLSLSLGRAIGLGRDALYTLGLCGLLHDLGKLSVPAMVLNKLGALTPEERKLFHDHPGEGFFSISSKLGVTSRTIPIALAAYEHHLNVDGTGYPAPATRRPPSLFSRIVAVADRYDAMTSARIYRRHAIPPFRALALMHHGQRSQIDATLLRYFMRMLGPYPMGSVVRLSDSSVGVVIDLPDHDELRGFPIVRLVLDENGEESPGETIDLAVTAKQTDGLRVDEPLDPADLGIDPLEHLIA